MINDTFILHVFDAMLFKVAKKIIDLIQKVNLYTMYTQYLETFNLTT